MNGTDGMNGAGGTNATDGETTIEGDLRTPPMWRQAGGETTDFGGNDEPTCLSESLPITLEEASERGFTPSADLALIEGQHEASFRWADQGTLTMLSVDARLESMSLLRMWQNPNISSEDECSDDLEYHVAIDLAAADSSIQGSFTTTILARFDRDGLGEAGEPRAWVASRLLNGLDAFQGTRTLFVDPSRPQWGQLGVTLWLGEKRQGSLEATVLYTDGETPRDHAATPAAAWSEQTAPEVPEWSEPPRTQPLALDDYASSVPAPGFDVWLYAWSEAAGAVLDVGIDGETTRITDVPTELTSRYLDLGQLGVGEVVSVDLANAGAYVGAYLRVGGCVEAASQRSPDGSLHLETTIEPQRCDPTLQD